jgi:cytochrome c
MQKAGARRSILAFFILAAPSCGASSTAGTTSNERTTAPIGLAPATFAEQVVAGERLFADTCAACHGDSGQGKGDAPALVGLARGALPREPPVERKLRRLPFDTLGDVAEFVMRTMPLNAPGRLSDEQYYSVLAFDLEENGIDLGAKKLDGALAASLEIPRK